MQDGGLAIAETTKVFQPLLDYHMDAIMTVAKAFTRVATENNFEATALVSFTTELVTQMTSKIVTWWEVKDWEVN